MLFTSAMLLPVTQWGSVTDLSQRLRPAHARRHRGGHCLHRRPARERRHCRHSYLPESPGEQSNLSFVTIRAAWLLIGEKGSGDCHAQEILGQLADSSRRPVQAAPCIEDRNRHKNCSMPTVQNGHGEPCSCFQFACSNLPALNNAEVETLNSALVICHKCHAALPLTPVRITSAAPKRPSSSVSPPPLPSAPGRSSRPCSAHCRGPTPVSPKVSTHYSHTFLNLKSAQQRGVKSRQG